MAFTKRRHQKLFFHANPSVEDFLRVKNCYYGQLGFVAQSKMGCPIVAFQHISGSILLVLEPTFADIILVRSKREPQTRQGGDTQHTPRR
jgi:hypothetical protein